MKKLLLSALLSSTFIVTGCLQKDEQSKTNFSWGSIIAGAAKGALGAAQLNNMSPKQERELGQRIHREYVKSGQFKIHNDPYLKTFVEDIGRKLVPFVKRSESDFKNPDYYSFYVVSDKNPNAFATMGGHVYVTTGLLTFLETEGALAGVIGHEIAHLDNKHSIKKMSENAILMGILSGSDLGSAELAARAAIMLASSKNSREKEYEADKHGLKYVKKSNYAASEMLQFFEKIKKEGSSKALTFLNSHPHPEDRYNILKSKLRDSDYNGDGMDKAFYAKVVCYDLICE